jgi:hypothetical protein
VVCLVVVAVEGFFSDGDSGADGSVKGRIYDEIAEGAVDVVHCGDDCSKIWAVFPRKEFRCVLEDLKQDMSQSCDK